MSKANGTENKVYVLHVSIEHVTELLTEYCARFLAYRKQANIQEQRHAIGMTSSYSAYIEMCVEYKRSISLLMDAYQINEDDHKQVLRMLQQYDPDLTADRLVADILGVLRPYFRSMH